MSHKKPEPIIPGRQPNICPVCGKASYSAAGIHPQCAAKQADDKRSKVLKEDRAEVKAKKPATSGKVSRWQKSCPKCKTSLHVRKKECDCGHTFADTHAG